MVSRRIIVSKYIIFFTDFLKISHIYVGIEIGMYVVGLVFADYS